MRGYAPAVVDQLDRARRLAGPQLLFQQRVRHRVVVLVDLDMIVEPDAAFLPLRELERRCRKPLEDTARGSRTARGAWRPDGESGDRSTSPGTRRLLR